MTKQNLEENSPMISDNQMMEDVKTGKVEKLAVLFEKYHVQLFNFFLRLTGNRGVSEDLVQDVFMRILKYRKTYRGQSKFTVWMYQIARNAHIDHLRKKKGELFFPISYDRIFGKKLLRIELGSRNYYRIFFLQFQ